VKQNNGDKSSCERRQVFHPLNSRTSQQDIFLAEATKRKWFEKNFNYSFLHEDAQREQERLFQESPARVKTQAQFRVVSHSELLGRRPILFSFSQCYWEDNACDHANCPFLDQDTVFLLSFAIIMLNTDLHKQSSPPTGKKHQQRKKMTGHGRRQKAP
jgi:hypothetical protein